MLRTTAYRSTIKTSKPVPAGPPVRFQIADGLNLIIIKNPNQQAGFITIAQANPININYIAFNPVSPETEYTCSIISLSSNGTGFVDISNSVGQVDVVVSNELD